MYIERRSCNRAVPSSGNVNGKPSDKWRRKLVQWWKGTKKGDTVLVLLQSINCLTLSVEAYVEMHYAYLHCRILFCLEVEDMNSVQSQLLLGDSGYTSKLLTFSLAGFAKEMYRYDGSLEARQFISLLMTAAERRQYDHTDPKLKELEVKDIDANVVAARAQINGVKCDYCKEEFSIPGISASDEIYAKHLLEQHPGEEMPSTSRCQIIGCFADDNLTSANTYLNTTDPFPSLSLVRLVGHKVPVGREHGKSIYHLWRLT